MTAGPRSRPRAVALIAPMVVLAGLLLVTAGQYGYHRDELYFRMLPLDWGYVDQPPLVPLLINVSTGIFGDSVVALRLPAILCAVASLPVLAALVREVGGSRRAQLIAVWGMTGATLTFQFGHVFLTASTDLVVWPLTLLFVMRAVGRNAPGASRWWLAAGAVVGIATYAKLLVIILCLGIALGLAVFGPRSPFRSRGLWAGVTLTGVLALPNLIYQATNGWPQLEMGAALGGENAAGVRVQVWPFLILFVGPVLAVFWVVALVGLFRRASWRPYRFLAMVFAVIVLFVFTAGSQVYYTAAILGVLASAGTVVVDEWATSLRRTTIVAGALGANAVGCAVTTLPLFPVDSSPATAIAGLNVTVGDQVGWEQYVRQIDDATAATDADVVITSNYGEAGALDRFGDATVPVVSGHNALHELGGPPGDADVAIIVGGQGERASGWFASCDTVAELDSRVNVDNEEQGQPVLACTGPDEPWSRLWPRFAHLS
ncbi:MAG: glycosyltransferase family 39 protein [Mycobacteriaceae bacterium]|uniref:glycosyltransferase family 39 protein n=1 Tax=Corynebacterium sp. TaxID=1720 RepID=UPI003F9DF260